MGMNANAALETVRIKERPILFSGPMVRAILAGRKTQTRRVVKDEWQGLPLHEPAYQADALKKCGYGQPGDRLWVRETWGWSPFASMPPSAEYKQFVVYASDDSTVGYEFRARPSIHMPRWACRLELDVTNVRIERLQSIREDDAKAEGARYFPELSVGTPFRYGTPCRWSMEDAPPNTDHCLSSARFAFANFWNKLRGYDACSQQPDAWDGNPWVWVVEFKRVA